MQQLPLFFGFELPLFKNTFFNALPVLPLFYSADCIILLSKDRGAKFNIENAKKAFLICDLLNKINYENNELYYIDIRGDVYIIDDNTFYDDCVGLYDGAKYCVVDGELELLKYCVYSEYHEQHVRKSSARYVQHEQDYFFTKDCVLGQDNNLNSVWLYRANATRSGISLNYFVNDEHFINCACCDSYNHVSECYDDSFCSEDCYAENNKSEYDLFRYAYHKDVVEHFGGTGKPELFIQKSPILVGLEYECNFEEIAETNIFNYCIPTHDASLNDESGVEYVFNAYDLNQQKKNVSDFLDTLDNKLSKPDLHSECGLHIHISKVSNMTHIAQLKLQMIFEYNKRFVSDLFGRASCGYAHIHEKDFFILDNSRYNAVNITNTKTIEYRLGAYTLDAEQIHLLLEFCELLTIASVLNIFNVCDILKGKAFKNIYNYYKDNARYKTALDYIARYHGGYLVA